MCHRICQYGKRPKHFPGSLEGHSYGDSQNHKENSNRNTDETHGILPNKSDRPSRHQYHTAVLGFLVGNQTVRSSDPFPEHPLLLIHPQIDFRRSIPYIFPQVLRLLIADNVPFLRQKRVFHFLIQIFVQDFPDIFHSGDQKDMPNRFIRGKAFDLPHQIDTVSGIFIFQVSCAVAHEIRLHPDHQTAARHAPFLALPFFHPFQEYGHIHISPHGRIQVILPEDQGIQIKNIDRIDILPYGDKRGVKLSQIFHIIQLLRIRKGIIIFQYFLGPLIGIGHE